MNGFPFLVEIESFMSTNPMLISVQPKQKTKAAIKKARLTEPVWVMLEQCHHETTNRPQDEPCKFCGKSFGTWKKLTMHLAKHLEHISLPILRVVEVVNVDADTVISPVEQARVPAFPMPTDGQSENAPSNPKPGLQFPHGDIHSDFDVYGDRQTNSFSGSGRDNFKASSSAWSHSNLPVKHDWDVQSLASINTFHDSALGSNLPSNISESVSNGLPKTAQEEILIILFSDAEFRSLLHNVATLISKQRFTRNIRRLLLPFQQSLQASAQDPREKDAASIIEKHAQWFASRLFDMSDPENESNAQNMAAYLNQHMAKRPMLERYLASEQNQPQSAKPHTIHQHDAPSSGESDSDDSSFGIEKYIDYSKFPNLERIKSFVTGGSSFDDLRRKTKQFLDPKETSVSAPKAGLALSSQESYQGSGSTESTEITIPELDPADDDDDVASINSDDPALGQAADDRILRPREYFGMLEDLERQVYNDSAFLFAEVATTTGIPNGDTLLQASEDNSGVDSIIEPQKVLKIIKFSSSSKLLQLLECYNIIQCTAQSLVRLREAGYCSGDIIILVKDEGTLRRPVAKAIPISLDSFLELGKAFKSTLQETMSELSVLPLGQVNQKTVDLIVERQDYSQGLSAECESMLITMGFWSYHTLPESFPNIWNLTVQSLQLCVLSYSGAHIQRFDQTLIGVDIESFQLPIMIKYQDATLQEIASTSRAYSLHEVRLQRRQLQCLDQLLGGYQPWVFHQVLIAQEIVDLTEPLHLSTSIESLTDLWGPSWKVLRNSDPERIQQYNIGNGSIVPWSHSPAQPSCAALGAGEVYCHWISSRDWNEQLVEKNQSSLPRKHLLSTDTLLIGASIQFGLNVNQDCSSSLERLLRIKTSLDGQGALRNPKTFRSKRYVDSQAVQVSGTALGVISGTGIITYKRRVGHTMKDALVERWRHNLWSPIDLEAFCGVEVSFCTRNARRRRLMHILASETMQNYLRTISFDWTSDACELSYFKALRSPKHFRRFWKDHKEWHVNVGSAISICLDALEETGIDKDSGELSALWIESFDQGGDSDGESDGEGTDEVEDEPSTGSALIQTVGNQHGPDPMFCEEHIVTLFRSEHTWTGFLQDSEESLTVAIVGMTCLDFLHENGYGRSCAGQRALGKDAKGFAVLQTSLKLNESILKNEKLTREAVDSGRKTIWEAKELKRGTSFSLGNHGTLKVLIGSTRTCPVIVEWSAIKSELAKEIKNVAINEKLLGRNAERHHCEYIRDSVEVQPLPVLVISKSTKVMFSEG